MISYLHIELWKVYLQNSICKANVNTTLTSNAKCVTMVLRGDLMEKSMTLNLRVNPVVKQQAEDVLKQLGIPMATAIDMYLRQIKLTGGIPFSVSLPKAPAAVNADIMSTDQLRMELMAGYDDLQAGNVQDAGEAFARFRDAHR